MSLNQLSKAIGSMEPQRKYWPEAVASNSEQFVVALPSGATQRMLILPVRARGAIFLLFSGVLLGGVFGGPALAQNPTDAQGYIENWPGNIVVELNSTPLPRSFQNQPPLSQDVQNALPEALLCSAIQSAATKLLGSGVKWDSCSVDKNPELRGRMSANNQLSLKIIFSNVNFSFDISGILGDNPTVHVSTTMEVDAVIGFAEIIDGSILPTSDPSSPYNTSPVSVLSAAASFSNATVSSSNLVFVIGQIFGLNLASLSAIIDQQTQSVTAVLDSQIGQPQNPAFHKDAVLLSAGIVTGSFGPPDVNATPVFLLAVNIDSSQNLVIDFDRSSSAPAPANCAASSPPYAEVLVECYSLVNGVPTFDTTNLLYLQHSDPTQNPAWVTSDDGWSNPWDTPPIRQTIPALYDLSYQTQNPPPQTVTVRVCSAALVNDGNPGGPSFGGACTGALTVTLNLKVPVTPLVGKPSCGPNSYPYQPCVPYFVPPSLPDGQGLARQPGQK